MPVFDPADISRFTIEAENEFVSEFPHLIGRYSFALVSGTAEYTLPDYVLDIRRITMYGIKIDPMAHRHYRDLRIPTTSTGLPKEYIFNNLGLLKIKLFPTPNINVAAVTSNLYGSNINAGIIVEFFRWAGDYPDTLPVYLRRHLLKCYVAYKCYEKEGSGQNLKAAKYYRDKWNGLKQYYNQILEDLMNVPRRIISGNVSEYMYRTPFAMLNPNKFGIGLDPGE